MQDKADKFITPGFWVNSKFLSISHYILPSGLRPLDTGLGRPRDGGGHHQRGADQVWQDPGIPCQGIFSK